MRTYGWCVPLALAALSGCSEEPKKTADAPKVEAKSETAPDVFTVNLDTSKGGVAIEVHRAWAPKGADHFYNLVKTRYYDGCRFFRVTRAYAQFGVNGDPQTSALWSMARIPDDPVKHSNVKGTLTFAQLGANSRTTQLFLNLRDNQDLDKSGFAPLGQVTAGMDVVERFFSAYGDMPPRGQGPDPTKIEAQGNAYLEAHFPRLDFVKKAGIQ